MDIRTLARLGAEKRLAELEKERQEILAFLGTPRARKQGGRKLTRAQRKAISLRMKRLWASRRKNKG